MKRWIAAYVLPAIFFGLIFFQCDDSATDTDDNGEQNSLTGTWTATKFEFTNKDNPAQTIDLVQQGFSVTIKIEADGSYALTIAFAGQVREQEEGTITIDGNQITVDPEGDDPDDPEDDPITTEFELSDNTLKFNIENTSWDFDNDGTDEAASLEVIFEKN